MEKYAVLSAVARGNFWERLCHLYMKTGDYVDMENLENRHIVYVKVFLSDIRNQYAALLESQLWHDYLSHVPCSVVGQAPLDGSKVSLLVCTSDASSASSFCSLRLCGTDLAGKDAYGQAVALFEKFVGSAHLADDASGVGCLRVWFYVADTDGCLDAVEKARDDVFGRHGIDAGKLRMAVTVVGGVTHADGAVVALDYLSFGGDAKAVVPPCSDEGSAKDESAAGYGCIDLGVDLGSGLRVDIPPFVLPSATDADMSQLDVRQYTGQILGDMGVRLKRYGLTMNHVSCFVAYLRDFSDYTDVDRLLSMAFPYVPHVIVCADGAGGCLPVMIECVAERPAEA